MSRGATLLELAIALAVLGLLALIGISAFGRVRDRLAVDSAAHSIAGAHARARLVAVTERRPVLLILSADSLAIHAVESPTDTVLRWRSDGPRSAGVASAGLPRQVAFAPNGLTLGVANGTCTLTRGSAQKQVVMSRYGRVRII